MSPVVRPLAPSDVSAAATLYVACFAGTELDAVGSDYVRRFILRFCTPRHLALVGVEDGLLCGFALGVPDALEPATYRRLLMPAVLGLVRRPAAWRRAPVQRMVRRRLRSMLRVGPRPAATDLPPPTMVLCGVGVTPARRGRGIGRALLAAWEREAARRGMASLSLTVEESNRAARTLYESRGWQPSAHRQDHRLCYSLTIGGSPARDHARSGPC